MKTTELPQGKFQAAIFKLGKSLGEAGGEILTRIDEDDAFRTKVADYMLHGAIAQASSQGLTLRIAKAIMGDDKVIGPDQVLRAFGIAPDDKDKQRIYEMADHVPYLPETLAACSKTHLLVWGVPADIDEITLKTKSFGLAWWLSSDEARAAIKVSTPTKGWYLISRGVSDRLGSTGRLATVLDVFYALSIHKLTNKRQIFLRDKYGVCNLTPEGEEVCFGHSEAFTRRYTGDQEEYRYWVKEDMTTDMKITVVIPDNPIH